MKVSLNWIKEFTPINLSIDDLVEKIGSQLGAVEEVVDLGKKYEGILIVKVVHCEKHPNADRLNLCLVDDGGVNKKVKRNADGLIEVVCGAPNVKAEMLAAWIPPGATVPSSPEDEPFVIEAREIRGQMSNGMLASAKELAIGDSHEGLLVIEAGNPGDSFAKSLWLDDYIIDIENKMFTHRPDCFGQLGVAREIAGITGQLFKSPDWYSEKASLPTDGRKNVLKLAVKNDAPKLVPHFCAVAFKDIKVAPSPAWMQSFLTRAGVRPINNIVDITNLVMLETGQPLHAYDYDKLKTGKLGARLSKKGEHLTIIGGKNIKLDYEAVVITDGEKPVGLGGVMGGQDTEVDNDTKNIILEAATFDMNATRRTAMSYGLFTDAATRFTKNQSPRQNMSAITRAASQIQQLAGGRQASEVIDIKHYDDKPTEIKLSADFINKRLGFKLLAKEVQKLLENVEFKVAVQESKLSVTVPFWRTDIEIPEDIVEEVGRLYGYDKLPLELPKRDLTPTQVDSLLDFKGKVRTILSSAGANEVLTYSFVHGDLLKKAGQDPSQSYQIANALSPDLQYYRLSLMPSLLEKVQPNIRAGTNEFALFELGKGHNKSNPTDGGEKVPLEFNMLSLVFASRQMTAKINGSPYYQAMKFLDFLANELGICLEYKTFAKEENYQVMKPFDYMRSAQIWDQKTQIPLGMIGEFKQSVLNSLKLPQYTAGFEVDLSGLLKVAAKYNIYSPLTRFPEVEQDFCLKSKADLSYAELTIFISDNICELAQPHNYDYTVTTLDIYQRENDDTHKQTTWRIILSHPERTLTTDETNHLLDELAIRANTKLGAERI